MVVRRVGVLGRTDTRTLIWFRLKKSFYQSMLKFCAKLYHHLKSRGMLFCKILSRLLL